MSNEINNCNLTVNNNQYYNPHELFGILPALFGYVMFIFYCIFAIFFLFILGIMALTGSNSSALNIIGGITLICCFCSGYSKYLFDSSRTRPCVDSKTGEIYN
jgi:ABC-type antimicrobial peptide transport system permease subunit